MPVHNNKISTPGESRKQAGLSEMDKFDEMFGDLEATAKRVAKASVLLWAIGLLFSLALSAVVIWAIVTVVLHFT